MRVFSVLFAMGLLSTTALGALASMTQDSGAPVGDNENSKTAGLDGRVPQDYHLIKKLGRFDRERIIPESVVHAQVLDLW
jgi:catalase